MERVIFVGYVIDQKSMEGQLRLNLTFISKDNSPKKYDAFIEEFEKFLIERREKN